MMRTRNDHMSEYCVTFGYQMADEDEASYTERDVIASDMNDLYKKLDPILDEANNEPGFLMWISKIEEWI